ncbi:uncharacterized protein LOC129963103 isoform X1 [Argiope bruennichi]|uniref:uncharacterized protein LOC129963103 isoform X1 n=1 Tax=Argiope bruennichi TaxID=94029 RepID=UPI0024957D62|nr:uncharacterized protein LOC129963103 isoform X1 [Argiope bruennichi]
MRVRWNRQLDGSLTRRQAEEEAAAAAELCKDKRKSTSKILRIFRRKKHHRRPDEESDKNPDASQCPPSDEDCASVSSVASQPVATELCHRDRTVSLFSSFRLNFPGGKKKSKRNGGTPLFQGNEPENSRYSSPDLVREKLGAAAHPQTELSKSSPSVRNTNDPDTSIPGYFPSLCELRPETSVSFQQLKHAGAKSGTDIAKLAKSVSFSDCQATLNSKQVTCASAKILRTPDGQTEPKTKTFGENSFTHSTEVQKKICESKSIFDDNDPLRLPTQPSFWKSAAEFNTGGAMSEISSSSHRVDRSCKETPRNKCVSNDARGKWSSVAHNTETNGNLFERSGDGPKICPVSDIPNVKINGNVTVACDGDPVSRNMCSSKFSACDFSHESSYIGSFNNLRTSIELRDSSNEVSNVCSAGQVPKSFKTQDESDRYNKMPFMKSTSQLLKNINMGSSARDTSENEVYKRDIESSTLESLSVLQNFNDSICFSTHGDNSKRKVLCNGDVKKYTPTVVTFNCAQRDVCNSIPKTDISEINDLYMVPDNEKHLLNEMLLDFGINTEENEEHNVSLGVKNSPKSEIVLKNSLSLNTLSLGIKKSNFVNDSDQSLVCIPIDNLSISSELVEAQSIINNSINNFIDTSAGSDFTSSVLDGNVVGSNSPDITKKAENTFASIVTSNIVEVDEPSEPIVKDEPIICVEKNDIPQFNASFSAAVVNKNATVDKTLEPNYLPNNLMFKENDAMSNVTIGDIDKSNVSLSSDLKSEKTSIASSKHSLLLTYLKSSNNLLNDSSLKYNFLSLLPENIEWYSLCNYCSMSKKASVLNVTCPIFHLDDLNNNALCDAESYLHKLTERSNDSILLFQNNSNSGKYARSVTAWNASFVPNLIFPCEIFPRQKQCVDFSGGRAPFDCVPSAYATVCGKLRLEERCPDAVSPLGSSSESVMLHRFDLHTDDMEITRILVDGSEMLAKVGVSAAFCAKSCTNPSVFLKSDEMKGGHAEDYDRPRYCEQNLVSLPSESYNPFSAEITFSGDWNVTKPSSNLLESTNKPCAEVEAMMNDSCCIENVSDLISLGSEMTCSETCSDSIPASQLISNGYYSGSSLQYKPDEVEPISDSYESLLGKNIKDQIVVNGSGSTEASDLLSHVIVTIREGEVKNDFSTLNSGIPNEYPFADDLLTKCRKGICDISMLLSECEDQVDCELEMKEKIQIFETGSSEISLESCDSICGGRTTHKNSLERSKYSLIPSLKKTFHKAVDEERLQKPYSKKFKNEGITRSSIDNSPVVTKIKITSQFENASPSNVLSDDSLYNSSFVNDHSCSSESTCKHSGVDNEQVAVSRTSSECAKRCKSEELLSSPSKVQKSKSRLQARRHSSTEANSCNITYEENKEFETASPADLPLEKEELSLQRSSLSEVRGQAECGLQSRCASLPLVMGQVRATSPLNYVRSNRPIKDVPRGKSRIPRKQTGVRSLHSKPVRPPMWLSKAELTAEIQRLGTLCEARTKELNRLKMETKHVSVGFDAFASLFKYMVEDLNALSMPMLTEDLKKTLKQLELAKQDLAFYEREVEEMKAHHCQELNDLSNKLFQVFHGEVTELSAKHQEEMNRLKSDHQLQIENLSSTFDATSQESITKHEAAVAELQQELISQREELQQLHVREIADLEAKHAQSTKTLQEHIEQLQKKCAELKQHSMGMEDAMRKDTDTKLQWVTSRKVDLEKEVESLKAVLEMKNKELHTLRVQNLEMEKQLEELPLAREKIKMLQARAEDLEALMIEKTKLERKLSTENQQIRDTYERESKVNKRLSMENEELLWRIRQAEQSFLSDSFSVAEYPEDVENGSISPTKSPPPHMSRSVFFTYMDRDDQTSSPRAQYKKVTPGFAASYKTSPYKSPPTPSPRRPKSNSEPPQPLSHGSSTPLKGSKQSSLKQKKRPRSGSDCGKVNSDQADVTFLSIAGSMTSSMSSENSVFGERLLEEHKEQILESLEILREQRSTESSRGEETTPSLEGEDMSRSSEFSDPKTYYHMTFPVSGMPDCDISVAAQAIHSTSESTSPAGETQSVGTSAGDCEKEEGDSIDSAKNVHESKEDRWRTI